MEEINQNLGGFCFEVLLVCVPQFTLNFVPALESMRQRFPHAALITVARTVDPSAKYQARTVTRHKLIEEDFELDDLISIVYKLRSLDPGALRMHPRANRSDRVELVCENQSKISARFIDFAQMGACLSFDLKDQELCGTLTPRKRVRLTYLSSSEPGKVHRIEAVVVWAQVSRGMVDSLLNGPTQRVGLRFIAAL